MAPLMKRRFFPWMALIFLLFTFPILRAAPLPRADSQVHETGLKPGTSDERQVQADLDGRNRLSQEGLKCSYDLDSDIDLLWGGFPVSFLVR